MQTVELTKREIEVILAMLLNCEGGPMRLGNNNISVSFCDDIDPMIDKFDAMLPKENLVSDATANGKLSTIVVFDPPQDYKTFDILDLKECARFNLEYVEVNPDDSLIDISFICGMDDFPKVLNIESQKHRPIAILSEDGNNSLLFPRVYFYARYNIASNGIIHVEARNCAYRSTEKLARCVPMYKKAR